MYSRLSEIDTNMAIATIVAARSTCRRRRVGAVITDAHNRIIGTGYNGVPKGTTHCIDFPCSGANAPTGTDLDKCEAIHAEVNALLNCHDPSLAAVLSCTTLPCMHCVKILANTNIQKIYYRDIYTESSNTIRFWINSSPNRIIKQVS